MSLITWIAKESLGEITRGHILLKSTEDSKLWRAMVTYLLRRHGTLRRRRNLVGISTGR